VLYVRLCGYDFESGIPKSRKRNDRLRFFERVFESTVTPPVQSAPNALFLEDFRFKLGHTPLLARALNRTNAENCIEVREVCNLARSIHSSRAHRRSLNKAITALQKFLMK